ncbi:hypothetical protein BSLG_003794 [Batrachochytrium salamandrivorans]|nr:hypothetical protein BSLG_003794 [Batrachochytrium salamandrivorans]
MNNDTAIRKSLHGCTPMPKSKGIKRIRAVKAKGAGAAALLRRVAGSVGLMVHDLADVELSPEDLFRMFMSGSRVSEFVTDGRVSTQRRSATTSTATCSAHPGRAVTRKSKYSRLSEIDVSQLKNWAGIVQVSRRTEISNRSGVWALV